MIDINNNGLSTTPTDVIIKGNLRWWAPTKPSDSYSQAIILSNRDISLKNWIEYALNNNIINPDGFGFTIVDEPSDLPVQSESNPISNGDVAVVEDIGNEQSGIYTWFNDQWNGPTLIGFSEASIAESASGTTITVPVPTSNILYYIDTTSADATFTLPDPSKTKYELSFKKTSVSGTVTINPNASELVEGSSFIQLYNQNDSTVLVSDGTNWYVKGSGGASSGSSSLQEYNLGSNVRVRASRVGVTGSLSSGVFTIIVPTNTILYRIEAIGDDTSAWVSGGTTKIVVEYQYDNNRNESLITMMIPSITLWDLTLPDGSNTSDSLPATQIVSDPPARWITNSVSNDITFTFNNLDFYTKWGIAISL